MVRLKENKKTTAEKAIEQAPLPEKAYIPLSQHIGRPCDRFDVKIGDNVTKGQKLAFCESHLFAPIHSSVSGKIISIVNWPHPVSGNCKALVIENDKKETTNGNYKKEESEIKKLSPEKIRSIVMEAGIVGMGGAAFPSHVKLSPPQPVHTLLINGAECEPYLTGDYRLMVEKTEEIIMGIELISRCLNIKKIVIGIEDNKPIAIRKFSESSRAKNLPITIKILSSHYPQGGEKQLIKNTLKKEIPRGKLPFNIGVVVHNVATVFAIYEAVYENKPLYERLVTVTGSCISNPKNLLARIGTPIKTLIDFCGPFKKEPAKIILGGPMMGIAQYTDQVPVIKSTTGIILLTENEASLMRESSCIRCGACVRECPVGLMPCLINLASEKENWALAKNYGSMDCIECGICSYVCPSYRKIVHSIKRAKLEGSKV